MRKLLVINGKRMRAPSYDDAPLSAPQPDAVQDVSSSFDIGFGLERDYPSTHDADRALLISLGVDGTVPLAQARVNAGLPADGSRPAKLVAGQGWVAANDNHELAAKAA